MKSTGLQAGRKLALRIVAIAGLCLFGSAAGAQMVGSQAANITFSQTWGPIPSGIDELNDYFVAPGYITLLELWAPGCSICQANVPHMNDIHNSNSGPDFQVIGCTQIGWNGCTQASIGTTGQSWGIQFPYAATTQVPAYYYGGGSLQFSTCFAFDRTGKLLWKGPASQVTNTMVQQWIANNPAPGGGGGGGGTGGGGTGGGGTNPPPNQAPIASAGSDQGATYNTLVTLNGGSSMDPEGGSLTYYWVQTQGGTVTLNGATTATPSFTSPATYDTLKFRLTVTDPDNASDTDDVIVHVNDNGIIPGSQVSNAGGGGCVAAGGAGLSAMLALMALAAVRRRRK